MMKPNILLIMADQWAAKNFGCYGSPIPEITPNVDALAARGARFSRFYASVPVCGPNRACLFTGRAPAAHGVWDNNIDIAPDVPLFTQSLQNANYGTWGIGKFHFSSMLEFLPDNFEHLGFDEVQITEDPKHGVYLDWIKEHHPEHYETAFAMAWPMPYIENYPPDGENLRARWQAAAQKWLGPRKAPPFRNVFHPSPLPAELHQTHWIADRAIKKLAAHDGAHPFFGYVSFVDPHDPYDPPAPYDTMFAPDEIPPPVAQEWTDDFAARDYIKFRDTMFQIADFSAEDWARLRALYFGSCRFVDDQIGRILAALRDNRLDENTVVIFLTDHGDLIGDHGLLMKGPWHYDGCIRCPLIIAGPNVDVAEINELHCSFDLAPTIIQLGDATMPTAEGRDLLGGQGWNEIAIQTHANYVDERGWSRTLISDDNWRLTLFPDADYGELFDLTSDPDEQDNLFRAPETLERRAEMMQRLVGAMARDNYPFPRGENSRI